jgi:hypothetical protein
MDTENEDENEAVEKKGLDLAIEKFNRSRDREVTRQERAVVNYLAAGHDVVEAALKAGYAREYANKLKVMSDKTKHRQFLQFMMDKAGVDEDAISNTIKAGMNAKKIVYHANGGVDIIDDYQTQHKFLVTALQAMGLKSEKGETSITVNNNLTYEQKLMELAEMREKGIIDIEIIDE